jgi:hypothetical protein
MAMNLFHSATSMTLTKLEGFANLQPGWHYGSGGPIPDAVIGAAKVLYRSMILQGLTRNNVSPGADGEVLLTAYHQEFYVSFMIEPNLAITATLEEGDEEISSVEGLDLVGAKQWLRTEATRAIWNTSGLFTRATMTTFAPDSMTWRLRSPPVMEECRFSTDSAPKLLVA